MRSVKSMTENTSSGWRFTCSGLLVRNIFEEIGGLAVERPAQRVQSGKAHGPAFIVFEDRQVCERYIYHGG